jgi:hypothetical protein
LVAVLIGIGLRPAGAVKQFQALKETQGRPKFP